MPTDIQIKLLAALASARLCAALASDVACAGFSLNDAAHHAAADLAEATERTVSLINAAIDLS